MNVAFAAEESFKLSSGAQNLLMTDAEYDRGNHYTEIETLCQEICGAHDICQEGTVVPRSCTRTITTPYANWKYDVEAVIRINAIGYTTEMGLADEVQVKLDGETLRLSSPTSQETALIAQIKKTSNPVHRRVKEVQFDVTLSTLPMKPLVQSYTVSDHKFTNGILTYEMGVEAGFPVKQSITIHERRFLRSEKSWSLQEADLRDSFVVENGIKKFSVDFKKKLEGYRGGNLDVSIYTTLQDYDSTLGFRKILNPVSPAISSHYASLKIR